MRISEPRVLLKWEFFNWCQCSRLPQVSWRKQGGCLAPQTQSSAGRWPVWLGLGGGAEKPRQVHGGAPPRATTSGTPSVSGDRALCSHRTNVPKVLVPFCSHGNTFGVRPATGLRPGWPHGVSSRSRPPPWRSAHLCGHAGPRHPISSVRATSLEISVPERSRQPSPPPPAHIRTCTHTHKTQSLLLLPSRRTQGARHLCLHGRDVTLVMSRKDVPPAEPPLGATRCSCSGKGERERSVGSPAAHAGTNLPGTRDLWRSFSTAAAVRSWGS